jgi:threonine-phosphate decarboxylase
MPGIRLGYILAAGETIRYLEEAREPWTVNTMAQAMGEACLRDEDFIVRTRVVVADELDYLHNELTQLDGLCVFPSSANYLLVKINRPGCTAAELQRRLLAHKILIRDASNFRGLDERFFRIAVRLRPENVRLLKALARVLKGR